MFREYGKLSTIVYEHTKPVGRSLQGDIEYYISKLENISGRVLEAGVGTGRMLIPFIQSGITVDGVDLSSDMLKQCELNMEEYNVMANLYHQDLSELSLPHTYDAIVMPTGSFCLIDRKESKKVLDNFYNHLNDGGKIIIDLEMPSYFRENEVSSNSFHLSQDTGIVLTSYSEKMDWLAQKTSYISKYELVKSGKVVDTEISNFILYWYGIEEFMMQLSLSRYTNISYEFGYGNDQSEIITFTAYK